MDNEVNTKERILNVTQELIQSRGYNSVSFNDIAEIVGIKKPSIVHHFPNKESLSIAVIKRYHEIFIKKLDSVPHSSKKNSKNFLEDYFEIYATIEKEKICLCGSLAGEFEALPDGVKEAVSVFFNWHIKWLTGVLQGGKKRGEFTYQCSAKDLARLILNSLQGALILQRATNDGSSLKNIISFLRSQYLKKV